MDVLKAGKAAPCPGSTSAYRVAAPLGGGNTCWFIVCPSLASMTERGFAVRGIGRMENSALLDAET